MDKIVDKLVLVATTELCVLFSLSASFFHVVHLRIKARVTLASLAVPWVPSECEELGCGG